MKPSSVLRRAVGLLDEVDRAELQRLDGVVGARPAEGRDDQHRQRILLQHARQQLQAVTAGQFEIERDDVGPQLLDRVPALLGAAGDADHLEARARS